jgi:hypothetical protein
MTALQQQHTLFQTAEGFLQLLADARPVDLTKRSLTE